MLGLCHEISKISIISSKSVRVCVHEAASPCLKRRHLWDPCVIFPCCVLGLVDQHVLQSRWAAMHLRLREYWGWKVWLPVHVRRALWVAVSMDACGCAMPVVFATIIIIVHPASYRLCGEPMFAFNHMCEVCDYIVYQAMWATHTHFLRHRQGLPHYGVSPAGVSIMRKFVALPLFWSFTLF